MAAPFLRTFKDLVEAKDWLEPVWSSAIRKCGEDKIGALKYIKGAMINHTRAEKAEAHGN